MLINFKIDRVDNGLCRINYTAKINGTQVHYCLMDDGYGDQTLIGQYICSKDGEPCHPAGFNKIGSYVEVNWEVPTGDSRIEQQVREYLGGLKQ